MNKKFSFIAVLIISIVLVFYRINYSGLQENKPLNLITWDAFGYYMYLPAIFIYNDLTELEWLPELDDKYSLTGGRLYQANKHTNDKYVFKYLGGVSITQAPLFFIAHIIAKVFNYEADGFSQPYQFSIAFGALVYCVLALFLLRNILLRYFDDRVTAITLLFLSLATNLIQYAAISNSHSHIYIFPMYVIVLYGTIKWHEKPSIKWVALIGFIIGLATISRPTEAIMFFIPLLWEMQTKETSKQKWKLVKANRTHIVYVVLFGLLGILPQLIYWKITSGSFVFNVGSKWVFLTPWLRVLFGFTNGWFIYTPITILFIVGMFFMKNFPFKKSVIVFCLLNIWIIISWFDWKYGATYSTRALVQSYPVFAFAFAAFIKRVETTKWRFLFYLVGLYLIFVNFFQIKQYNSNVLHYRDMNIKYYSRIYLNPNPSLLDMSLLDTDEVLNDESGYEKIVIEYSDSLLEISISPETPFVGNVNRIAENPKGWIKIEASIKAEKGFGSAHLHGKILSGDFVKEPKIRLKNPMIKTGEINNYIFYMKIPECKEYIDVSILITAWAKFNSEIESYKITYLKKN